MAARDGRLAALRPRLSRLGGRISSQGNLGRVGLLHRLTVGRGLGLLALLKDTRLFQLDEHEVQVTKEPIATPHRGCQAVFQSKDVLVLDTFLRYNVATADVAVILPGGTDAKGPYCKLGDVMSLRLDELVCMPLLYDVEVQGGGRVLLRPAKPAAGAAAGPDVCRAILAAARPPSSRRGARFEPAALGDEIPCVKPAAAALHVSIAAVLGEDHHVHPVHDRYQDPLWVQDLPLPWCFYARPYRCRTCNNRGSLERRVPLSMLSSLPPEARQEYFPVITEDIFTSLPEVLIFSEAHKGKTYLTARFFYEISQRLYECFNSREVRRHVAALYSANALAEAATMESRGLAPYSLVWLEAALVVSLIEHWRDRDR